MRFAGLECDTQRLAGAEQVFLADDLVDSARTQTLGKRNIGTVFFEHGALEGFRISLAGSDGAVRAKTAIIVRFSRRTPPLLQNGRFAAKNANRAAAGDYDSRGRTDETRMNRAKPYR